MKKIMIFAAATSLSAALTAGIYGDTPDAKHAWAVHDRNRPNPVKVTANPGGIPSDAVILFDGSKASFDKNWCSAKDPTKNTWKFVDGTMESVKGAGYIRTKESFGDCQLHLEWASPAKVEGIGQGRGNSGVFIMGNYEIQVLDSYETDPSKNPNPNPNYADGQASAVYAENPPLVNACRGPGEWQTYDIVFHQPIWKDGKMIHPGSITVFHNGVLTQDHWEMEGLTTHARRRPLAPHATRLPLSFQDHGNPVRFRNVWIREIPSRYANTTHGGPNVKEADVMALRAKTAAKLFALVDSQKCDAATISKILEVISYSKEEKYLSCCKKAVKGYIENLDKLDSKGIDAKKGEILQLKRETDTLIRNKVMEKCCLNAKLTKIAKDKKWIK
jgi:uncharacterized protein YnzC (UPF0291/DUF896 family)